MTRFAILIMATSTAAFAQQWEVGTVGGGGFLNHVPATAPTGSATAGFAPGFAAGIIVRENMRSFAHISGEVRYEYLQSDLRLSAGGQSAQFTGASHAMHYDLIYHTNSKASRAQFFGAAGGGAKLFVGSGTEAAFQPLSQYGYFTKTTSLKPMASAGGGFTYRMRSNLVFRAEVRDFVTAFPTGVLTPPPGVKYGKVLNDIVPMVGVTYVFRSAPTEPPPSTTQ